MNVIDTFSRIPGDVRRLIGLAIGYRSIQALMCSCKRACTMFSADAEFWKLVKNKEFLEKPVDSSKLITHSEFFPRMAITKLKSQRSKMATDIVELALRFNGVVFGGFVRDYISKRKEFSDIDIHFTNSMKVTVFIQQLKHVGFQVEEIYVKEWKGYHSHLVDGGQQMRYKVSKGQVSFEVDIRTKCVLGDDGADFDINGFYLIPSGFLRTTATSYGTPLGLIRHLTWCENRASDYIQDHTRNAIKYQQILIKSQALMVEKFNQTIKNCKQGKFLFAKGYKENPEKYKDRLSKMLNHGYICADKASNIKPKSDAGWTVVKKRHPWTSRKNRSGRRL